MNKNTRWVLIVLLIVVGVYVLANTGLLRTFAAVLWPD